MMTGQPFFSICIPQYNRTSHLLRALDVLGRQTCRDFEICISDDRSPDGRSRELLRALEESGMTFRYYLQPTNLRYDGNLRTALSLARGKYCLLMGNDDCLAAEDTLERLRSLIESTPRLGVVITNYRGYASGEVFRRVRKTRVLTGSPDLAAGVFRNFSFVSGVVLRRDLAHEYITERWDGAEMYQMYLGVKMLAEGYNLLEVDEVCVLKDLPVDGETVDSYAARPRLAPCPIVERRIPLVRMGSLVHDALRTAAGRRQSWLGVKVFSQILLFTYCFWLVEYRRVQSWRYALGICLGMRPRNSFLPSGLAPLHNLALIGLYVTSSCVGLLTPIPVFERLRPLAYSMAKRVR